MKAVLGAIVWIALIATGYLVVDEIPAETRHALSRSETELWRGVLDPSPSADVRFPRGTSLDPGDGVYRLEGVDLLRIGEVARTESDDDGVVATLLFDTAISDLDLRQDTRLVRRTQGQSLLFCIQTLFTDEQWATVQERWYAYLERYQTRLLAELGELVPDLLRDISAFLTAELDRVIGERTPEFEALLQRFRREIAEERGVPLLIEEVWPIVLDEAEEPATKIGRELWDRAPLFGLAWRAAWDSVVPESNEKLESHWRDFLEEEVPPVLKEHEPLLRETANDILKKVAASETVRSEVREAAQQILEDDEVRDLAKLILKDLVVNNPNMMPFLISKRDDPELRRRLQRVNDQLQVFLNEFGNLLVYADDDRKDINPDLAKLLRILLLRRDRTYLFLELGSGEPLPEGAELVGVRESN